MFDDLQSVKLNKYQRAELKRARKATRWSVADLAHVANVARGAIFNYETGKSHPKLATLRRICRALGLSLQVKQTVRIGGRAKGLTEEAVANLESTANLEPEDDQEDQDCDSVLPSLDQGTSG